MAHPLRTALITAIRLAQSQIAWKPSKAEVHLAKRIRLEHLPPGATLTDYESLIADILNMLDAKVYAYAFGGIIYPTLVSPVNQRIWLVMIAMDGVLETAFPPDMPEDYLSNPSFTYVGRLGELS
jgi:hypothetical protein